MTLYLHIGTDKTGSTAIQKLLHWNRERLLEHGLYYPKSGLMHYDHARLKLAIDNSDREPWNALCEEVSAYAGKDIVISHEGFYNLCREDLLRLREWLPSLNVRIVLYLRRQDDMIESGILQQLKTREVIPDLDEFESGEMPWRPHLDYAAVFSRWAGIFGAEAITLRPYGRAFLPDDKAIYRDFLVCIDRDPAILEFLELPARDPNPSLDAASASVLVFLHQLGLVAEQHDAVTDLMLYFQQQYGRSRARVFTVRQRQALLERYAESNKQLCGLPEALFSLGGDHPVEVLQQQEITQRLNFLYKERQYLIGCCEWYGEAGFPHLVRSGRLRLLKGFYPLEDWGAWMKGNETSSLVFRVPRTMQGDLELTLKVQYLHQTKTRTRARTLTGNWQDLGAETKLHISSTLYREHFGMVFLEFRHEHPNTPIAAGVSETDRRVLGAGLLNIAYREVINAREDVIHSHRD